MAAKRSEGDQSESPTFRSAGPTRLKDENGENNHALPLQVRGPHLPER